MHKDTIIAWTLFTIGFFVAAATAMPIPPRWGIFAGALAVSLVGALLARRAAARHARGGAGSGAVTHVEAAPTLRRIAKALEAIDPDGDAESFKLAIEHCQLELIPPLVAERRRFLHEHGPVVFAQFFGAFARGERFVNRCWSALVDEHRDEARSSLERARLGMAEAVQVLEEEKR